MTNKCPACGKDKCDDEVHYIEFMDQEFDGIEEEVALYEAEIKGYPCDFCGKEMDVFVKSARFFEAPKKPTKNRRYFDKLGRFYSFYASKYCQHCEREGDSSGVYTAYPCGVTPGRNDDLIFGVRSDRDGKIHWSKKGA